MTKLPISFGMLATTLVVTLTILALVASGKVPLRYNVRNLAVRWKTTLMTGLAFTLVVGLLTVMLAFVNGMRRLTENSGHPENVVVLSEGATDEAFSNLGFSDTSDLGTLLDQANRERLEMDDENRPLVSREKYMVVGQPLGPPQNDGKPRRSFIQVRGIENPLVARAVHQLELLPGGEWWRNGVRTLPGSEKAVAARLKVQALAIATQVAAANPGRPAVARPLPLPDLRPAVEDTAVEGVLGEGIARELGRARGKETLAVGDIFDLGPRKWVVVGIIKSAGTTLGSEVWGDSALVGDMFGKKVFTSLVVRTRGAAEAEEVAKALADRNITRGAAFAAQTEPKYFASLGTTNQQFLVAVIIVALIIAVGGIFGVMNTMFAAVSQRSRDIGVLRIIGFARWQILVSFFLESIGIALVGGLLGLALGSLVDGTTATSIVSRGQGGGKSVILQLTVDANAVLLAVLFSLIMGALGGLFPALSAMRQRPLEALR
jgi:ABC-type lipoprotein release transport system permease subunit